MSNSERSLTTTSASYIESSEFQTQLEETDEVLKLLERIKYFNSTRILSFVGQIVLMMMFLSFGFFGFLVSYFTRLDTRFDDSLERLGLMVIVVWGALCVALPVGLFWSAFRLRGQAHWLLYEIKKNDYKTTSKIDGDSY